MNKKWKKRISILISLICVFYACTPVYASESMKNYYEKNGYIYYDNTSEEVLNKNTLSKYSQFEVEKIGENNKSFEKENSIKEYVLSQSTMIDDYYVADMHLRLFESNTLSQSLYDCKEIVEILLMDNLLYITYFTNEAIEVRLCYDDVQLTEKTIYYPETDIAIIHTGDLAVKYKNFRTGCGSVIKDEYLQEIERLYMNKDWDALNKLEAFESQSNNSNDTNLVKSTAAGTYGFTSDAQMLADLKSKFPMKTNEVKFSRALYTPILAKNYRVKVLDDRNGYVKKTSDWRLFGISSTVSGISTYLTISTGGVLSILDIIGIGISVVDGISKITESVTLYRSAKYQYFGARDGYVLDDTSYNEYVHVIFRSGYGEFAGGYNSNDIFTWIESEVSKAYDMDGQSVAEKALEYYAKDVYANGYCSTYWPD